MKIRIIIDSDEISRKIGYEIKTLRATINPYRRFPTILKCSCGHITDGNHDGHHYMVTDCEKCHAENPRHWEYEYLTWSAEPREYRWKDWEDTKPFRWWVKSRAENREKKWAKMQREIDRAKTADRKRGIHLGRRPRAMGGCV